MITNTEILNYIFATRISQTQKRYLLGDNTQKGLDSIDSSLFWINSRFVKAGRADFFNAFVDYVFAMSSQNMSNLGTVKAYFKNIDSDNYLKYSMMFDSLILLSIYNLYSGTEQESVGLDKKNQAVEIIEGILGDSAFVDVKGSSNKTGAVVSVALPDEDTKTAETYNFRIRRGYTR